MSLPDDDTQVLLLHNPRCSKSRATRALLEEKGVSFSVRAYLDEPLDRGELEELGRRLGAPATQWARSGEGAWAEAGLGSSPSEGEVLDAMVAHPVLMQRPIVVRGGRAAIGRPPEQVLDIL